MGDFNFDLPKNQSNVIKVIGVGGGGSNAVNHMFTQGIKGVDYVICNTDAQALSGSSVPNKIQLGASLTEGLGAGADPDVGMRAAEESIEELKAMLEPTTKMVFITAGMGGGTGTGAAPIIAKTAKELGILTVGIVTIPFSYEGKKRSEQAHRGVEKLRENVDSLIVINNNKLTEIYGDLGFKAGYAKADEVLTTAAKGIAEVISKHYIVNIDLHDAKTVLEKSGTAIMGSATASGENRAKEAVVAALNSPLLNDNKIVGAQKVLLLIVFGTSEATHSEVSEISMHIQNEARNEAEIIMGVGEDEALGDNISVTVIATGFDPEQEHKMVNTDPKKIIHTLTEEQEIVHNLSEKQDRTIYKLDDFSESDDFFLVDTEEKIIQQEPEMIVEEENPIFNIEVDFEWIQPEKRLESIDETSNIKDLEKSQKETSFQEPQRVNRFEAFQKKRKTIQVEQPSLFDKHSEEADVNPLETPIQSSRVMGRTTKREEISKEREEKTYYSLEDYTDMENQLTQAKLESSVDSQNKEEEIRFEVRTVDKDSVSMRRPVEEQHLYEEEVPAQKIERIDPTSHSISELKKNTPHRQKVFKKYNYQFNNNYNIEDRSEPAYRRQGIVLDELNTQSKVSRVTISEDVNGELKIRKNNSYFHDNVD